MNTKIANQIAEMKKQTIGVEVEMNNISRQAAAKIAAEHDFENDRVIVLDKGKLVECGTHTELLEKKGFYWRLVMAQRQDSGMLERAKARIAQSAAAKT